MEGEEGQREIGKERRLSRFSHLRVLTANCPFRSSSPLYERPNAKKRDDPKAPPREARRRFWVGKTWPMSRMHGVQRSDSPIFYSLEYGTNSKTLER